MWHCCTFQRDRVSGSLRNHVEKDNAMLHSSEKSQTENKNEKIKVLN